MPTDPAPSVLCPAERYRVLTVGGRDAASFLQGQLTRDVVALGAGELALAALLTPPGRVIATPWLARAGEGYALVLPALLAARVRERLQRFVLRAKVALAVGELDEALARRLAERHDESAAAAPAGLAPGERWALALVRAGVPEIGVEASEEWIPQMLNLDLLGAVSFEKGCYTGQEIVARTQHLGRIKRRMLRFAADAARPPPPKAALYRDEQKSGEVVLAAPAASGVELLAVVSLEARDGPLVLEGGAPCRALPLPYTVP
jgi:tRNA-modifying protein YgfZ